jgi:uncharacterized protein YndB with AHSA1/START domain
VRAILVFLVLLAALLVVIVCVGALLPKSHVVTRTARYQAKPEIVWATITDYKSFPQWRTDLRGVEAMQPKNGLPAWRERGTNGDIPYEVVELRAPTRMVTKIADPNLPFGGTWEYDLQPAPGGGSALTITERGEVYNPVFRFVSKFVMGQTVTVDRYLRSLGRKFGEIVNPA